MRRIIHQELQPILKHLTKSAVTGLAIASITLILSACTSPLARTQEQAMHDRLVSFNRRHLKAIMPGAAIQVHRLKSIVDAKLPPERKVELDKMSGPHAYQNAKADIGADLLGHANTPEVEIQLHDVIRRTLKNNLTLLIARVIPAIDQTQMTQAEAAFDATYFANVDWSKSDTPNPSTNVFIGGTDQQRETLAITTGIRKLMSAGGTISLQTDLGRDDSSLSQFSPGAPFKYNNAGLTLSIQQPLLRNFGTDVNRSQIQLATNLKKRDQQSLRRQLLESSLAAEQAYWELFFARQQLLIRSRLLERTMRDRDMIEDRKDLDATLSQITQANSTVASNHANVIRARQVVRNASDNLKILITSKDLPVSGETQLKPLEIPIDTAIEYSLLDAVTTALRKRPEVRDAMLKITDASIRQRVADNLRLPLLNLTATVNYNGVGNGVGKTYNQLFGGNYIDYILSAAFEMPIGNRAAEAGYRQRQIERQASVYNYEKEAQQVVLEVKNALRNLQTSYELIGAERAARRAAAENFRALEAQEDAGAALTPEFLDLKLRRQDVLATSEIAEVRAMVDYNIAIAQFYLATGTLLERNGFILDSSAKKK